MTGSGEPPAADPPATPSDPPVLDITLEEWVAAGQSCCGLEPDDEGLS